MSRPARLARGALVAAAVTLGTAALSRLPYDAAPGDDALLRLSWRARGEQVRECRRLSAAELEAQPVHMRRTEVCEARSLPYHLRVRLDGRAVLDDTLYAGGARGDRPIYVFREVPLPAGAHRLQVEFVRRDGEQPPARNAGVGAAADAAAVPRHADATPARLALDTVLRLDADQIVLLTYDADRRALVARGAAAPPPAP